MMMAVWFTIGMLLGGLFYLIFDVLYKKSRWYTEKRRSVNDSYSEHLDLTVQVGYLRDRLNGLPFGLGISLEDLHKLVEQLAERAGCKITMIPASLTNKWKLEEKTGRKQTKN